MVRSARCSRSTACRRPCLARAISTNSPGLSRHGTLKRHAPAAAKQAPCGGQPSRGAVTLRLDPALRLDVARGTHEDPDAGRLGGAIGYYRAAVR